MIVIEFYQIALQEHFNLLDNGISEVKIINDDITRINKCGEIETITGEVYQFDELLVREDDKLHVYSLLADTNQKFDERYEEDIFNYLGYSR